MTGQLRLKGWLPFSGAESIDAQHGFVWTARVGRGPLVVTGSDHFLGGVGAMDWRLWGRVPLAVASGPDVTRSAAWRFAAEALTWLPRVAADQAWCPGPRAGEAIADVRVGCNRAEVLVEVDADGRLAAVSGPRWGNPIGLPFGEYPFRVEFLDEIQVCGITLPSEFRACWGYGTSWQRRGEFFRARISDVAFGAEIDDRVRPTPRTIRGVRRGAARAR
jgi:hypothetical protein